MPTSTFLPTTSPAWARPDPAVKHSSRAVVVLVLGSIVHAAPAAAQDADEGIVVSATRTERRNLSVILSARHAF